jgi:PEP-CTERM motif-containing protein
VLSHVAALAAIGSCLYLASAISARGAAITVIAQPTKGYLDKTTLIKIGTLKDSDSDTGENFYQSISGDGLTVTFSAAPCRTLPAATAGSPDTVALADPCVGKFTVGKTWGTWNCPPFTEMACAKGSVTPTGLPVLWSGDWNYQKFKAADGSYFYDVLGVSPVSTVTMTLAGAAVKTFGFEAQPDSSTVDSMTATFYNGATTLGSIPLNVSGNGGALLFAATSDTAFTKVVLTDTTSSGPAACAQPNCDDFAFANVRFSSNPIPEPASLLLLGTGIATLGLRKLRR